jgi:hypothetical protein
MVNVSHLAEEIENYFRDGQRFGVEISYSLEGRIEDGRLIGQRQTPGAPFFSPHRMRQPSCRSQAKKEARTHNPIEIHDSKLYNAPKNIPGLQIQASP